jgi:hypothetical protein
MSVSSLAITIPYDQVLVVQSPHQPQPSQLLDQFHDESCVFTYGDKPVY